MGCSCVKQAAPIRTLNAYRADEPTTPTPHPAAADLGEQPPTAPESSVAWSPGKVVDTAGSPGSVPNKRTADPRTSDAASTTNGEALEVPPPKVVHHEEVLTADGGVKKKIVIEGQGSETPPDGSVVTLEYVGLLEDGTQFESTREFGEPLRFRIGGTEVVPGLEIGVMQMRKGEQAVLRCAADYAYGHAGVAGKVPGGANIVLVVDLKSWYVPAEPPSGCTSPEPRPRDEESDSHGPPSSSDRSHHSDDHGTPLTIDAGVRKVVVQAGFGPVIPEGAVAIVHYVSLLEDGVKLESTYEGAGDPVHLPEDDDSGVPKGVCIGARTMRKNEQAMLRCAPAYAYPKLYGDVPITLFVVDLVGWEGAGGTPKSSGPDAGPGARRDSADSDPGPTPKAAKPGPARAEVSGPSEDLTVTPEHFQTTDAAEQQTAEGEDPEPEPEPAAAPPQQPSPRQDEVEDTFGTSCTDSALHARVQKASPVRGPAEGAEDEAAVDSDDEFANSLLKSDAMMNHPDGANGPRGSHDPVAEVEPASPIEIPIANALLSVDENTLSPLSDADIVRRVADSLEASPRHGTELDRST
eukprot:EG_transcript_7487